MALAGLSAHIYQLLDVHPCPIANILNEFININRDWGISDKELHALIYSLEKFKPYLYRPQFTWITNAKCFKWLESVKDTSPKLIYWILQIQGIDFSVQTWQGYRRGGCTITNYPLFFIQKHQMIRFARYPALYHTRSYFILELIIEPYAPFSTPDILTSALVETSSLVHDRTNTGSDECVLTDLAAPVAAVFPDRGGIAMSQSTDAFFGPILSALEHTSSVRSRIRNDNAISSILLYKIHSGSMSKYIQARLCVPNSMADSLFKNYRNSSFGGHFNGLRTYDRLRVLYTWPNMCQDIFTRCDYCHSCNYSRLQIPDTREIMSSAPPTHPFEMLSVDLIKLPR
jgi:hypothetical protein